MLENSNVFIRVRVWLRVAATIVCIAAASPAWAQRDTSFRESELDFTAGNGLVLHGTLTVPNHHRGAPPVVVFVHGSGPQTRDESFAGFVYDSSFAHNQYDWLSIDITGLGLEAGRGKILMSLLGKDTLVLEDLHYVRYGDTIRPFRDIAHFLARRGIASFRYDKRSYTYGKQLIAHGSPPLPAVLRGVDDYVVDLDSAIASMLRLRIVDRRNIFILAHSEGAAGIGQLSALHYGNRIRGLMLLAPSAEPIDQTMHRQLVGTAAEPIVDSLLALVRANAPGSDGLMILNASGAYWRSWMRMTDSAFSYTRALTIPTLLINGSLDLNVGPRALDTFILMNGRFTILTFGGLDHAFRYPWGLHVDEEVQNVLVEWIRRNRRK